MCREDRVETPAVWLICTCADERTTGFLSSSERATIYRRKSDLGLNAATEPRAESNKYPGDSACGASIPDDSVTFV